MENPTPEAVKGIAEGALAATFGMVRLDTGVPLDSSDRSNVFRFRVLDGANDVPATVIVKRAVTGDIEADDPDQPGGPGPATRLFNEWASLQFLGEVAPDQSLAPRFYGGDRDAGVLVMEDLGPAPGLTSPLLGDDPAAAEAELVTYATTLGQMHGRTVGQGTVFNRIREVLGPSDEGLGHDWLAPTFHAMLDALRLTPTAAVDGDLTLLEMSIADPGEFAAFIHSDPCPGNWLLTGSTVHLFDFEFARIGHALLDGVYGRVPFPTCWCIGQLPERVTRRMERAYRTELKRGCLAARNDARYRRAVAEACAFWLILICRWLPMTTLLETDHEWGTGTMRQRLLGRLDVVVQTTREAGHLAAIGELAGTMSRELHGRWDGEVAPLPLYPAFQTP